MPRVSIVVPAYNAERTLELTLNDLLNQSYHDFEIVIVDDGSTDQTPEICENFKKAYENIRVLHQKNGGLSNARNNGTKFAEGTYVTYVDSDDRVNEHFLRFLINALDSTGADIACGRIDKVKEEYESINSNEVDSPQIEIFDKKQIISEMLTGKKIWVGSCCRLVPRKWMIEEPFIEGSYYEDLSNTYRVNLKADKMAYVNMSLYYYVMHGGSITAKLKPSKKQCYDYYKAVNMCAKGCMKVFPELQDDVSVLVARDYMSLYLHIRRCEEKDSDLEKMERKIVLWLKRNWWHAATDRKAPLNVRMRTVLCGISPWLYEKVYYIGIRFTGKKIA